MARGLEEQPTIHEGVAARALERKGIVSERCELNRQIRADNALLRELKSLVKRLVEAVKNTIPAIAEAMETVRQKMIIFRYQLLHIKSGKAQITNTLQVVRPDLKQFEDITRKLKARIQERRTLLEEKKGIPAIQVFRHRELAQKTAALTEDIEELKSEKALLLNQLDCVGDHGMTEVKQRVASMESSLKKLDQQEIKYTAELDSALKEYADLKEKATEFGAVELMRERLVIRPGKERSAVVRMQSAYGGNYQPSLMCESKQNVSKMLGEEVEARSIWEKSGQKQQPKLAKKTKSHEQER